MLENKDLTILVVDDEADLRKALVFDFQRKGFKTKEAENGRQAFDIVKSEPIDVVLTDVRMPNGDGIELLDRIKERNPNMPVVMLITGFADLSTEDAFSRGADAVFSKPFDRKELFEALRRVLMSKDELWGKRRSERLETNFKIDLRLPELNTLYQGQVLNIGRGGLFVAMTGTLPKIGDKVSFRFNFEKGEVSLIEGTGIVRWVRPDPGEGGKLPVGYGVEFDYVDDQSRKNLLAFVDSLKKKSFIPKS